MCTCSRERKSVLKSSLWRPAQVRTLNVPGSELSDVYYLRTLEDSKRIRQKAGDGKRAVVIGGGFIGMEVTSVLAQKGIETTMVLPDDRIWKRFFTAPMSRFFEEYYWHKACGSPRTTGW